MRVLSCTPSGGWVFHRRGADRGASPFCERFHVSPNGDDLAKSLERQSTDDAKWEDALSVNGDLATICRFHERARGDGRLRQRLRWAWYRDYAVNYHQGFASCRRESNYGLASCAIRFAPPASE
jgi:hypothetical protein